MKQSSNNFFMPLLDSNINRCKTILEKSIQINISLLVLTYNININELIGYLCILWSFTANKRSLDIMI